jgi:hypothetical protein
MKAGQVVVRLRSGAGGRLVHRLARRSHRNRQHGDLVAVDAFHLEPVGWPRHNELEIPNLREPGYCQ